MNGEETIRKDIKEIEKLLYQAEHNLRGYYSLLECIDEAEMIKEEILSYDCHTNEHIKRIDLLIEKYETLSDAEDTYYQLEEDGVFDDWD